MADHLRLHIDRWEGVYASDFSLDEVRRRCYGLGTALLAQGWSCLVTCDTRFMSSLFARDISHALQAQGVPVSLVPTPSPLPAVQYALEQRRASCALIVTASNQAYWRNGLLLLTPQVDVSLQNQPENVPAELFAAFPPSETNDAAGNDLRTPYLDLLRSQIDVDLIRRTPLTVFVDTMHGTTAGYIPAAIGEGAQTKAIEINRETDPLFGRGTPQPVGAPLMRLRKLVRESDSNLGIALSADGSAISVIDKAGDSVSIFELALVLAAHLSRQHRQRGLVIVPQVDEAMPGLQQWGDGLGLTIEQAAQPRQRIAQLIAHDRNSLVIGASSEGEISCGRFSPYADGLYAGLLTMELLARAGGNLRALVDEVRSAIRGKG